MLRGGLKKMSKTKLQEIKQLINNCTDDECKELLQYIRTRVNIHPLEEKLGCKAEIILEAIARASDLTLRGIRGIIAEAAFKTVVLNNLTGWEDITPEGDYPFDFKIKKSKVEITIQVKMQRLKNHLPMKAKEGYKIYPDNMYVVETQRTRGGILNGEDSRPYRFGEFDILAVSLHPSTNNWKDFMYIPSKWLISRRENEKFLMKFQPVAKKPNKDWTNDLLTCIEWHSSNIQKKLSF